MLAWILATVELALMVLQWHGCRVNCIDRRVAPVLIFIPGFVTSVWEAGDDARAYTALTEHWYNVCSSWVRDCVLPGKDFCCNCGYVMPLISLFVSLMTESLYRFHDGWNASEEPVERYACALGFPDVE